MSIDDATPPTEPPHKSIKPEKTDSSNVASSKTPPIIMDGVMSTVDNGLANIKRDILSMYQKNQNDDNGFSKFIRGNTLSKKTDLLNKLIKKRTVTSRSTIGSVSTGTDILLETDKNNTENSLSANIVKLLESPSETETNIAITSMESSGYLAQMINFQEGQQSRYMKHNLINSYKQTYLLKEVVKQIEQLTRLTDIKLEAIKLNTSAADVAKRSLHDMAYEQVMTGAVDMALMAARDQLAPIFKSKIYNPIKEKTSAYLKSDTLGASTIRNLKNKYDNLKQQSHHFYKENVGDKSSFSEMKKQVINKLNSVNKGSNFNKYKQKILNETDTLIAKYGDDAPALIDGLISKYTELSNTETFKNLKTSTVSSIDAVSGHVASTYSDLTDDARINELKDTTKNIYNNSKKTIVTKIKSQTEQVKNRIITNLNSISGSIKFNKYKQEIHNHLDKLVEKYGNKTPKIINDLIAKYTENGPTTVFKQLEDLGIDSIDTVSNTYTNLTNETKQEELKDSAKALYIKTKDNLSDKLSTSITNIKEETTKDNIPTTAAQKKLIELHTLVKKYGSRTPKAVTDLISKYTNELDSNSTDTLKSSMFNKASEVSGSVKEVYNNLTNETKQEELKDSAKALYIKTKDNLSDKIIPTITNIKEETSAFVSEIINKLKMEKEVVSDLTVDGLPIQNQPFITENLIHDELKSFHETYTDNSNTLLQRTENMISLLNVIAENSLGEGDGTTGKGRYSTGKGFFKTTISDILKLPYKAIKYGSRLYGKTLNKSSNIIGSVFGKLNPFIKNKSVPFVDVYLKGEVYSGNPLVTARKFKTGLVFSDGEPVGDVVDINRPVMDPTSKEVLISQEDIDTGLVDINGTHITKRKTKETIAGKALGVLSGFARGGVRAVGSIFSSKNPLFGIYAKLLDTLGTTITGITGMMGKGIAGAFGMGKSVGKGAMKLAEPLMHMYRDLFNMSAGILKAGVMGVGKIVGRIFGINIGNGTDGTASAKDLEQIVGQRLDDIYELLIDNFSKSKVTGDADGDGDRDGSYADYKQKLNKRRKSREEKVKETSTVKATSLFGGIKNIFKRKNKDASEDNEDGLFSKLAAGAAGAAVVAGYGKAKKVIGKGIDKVKNFGNKVTKGAATAISPATKITATAAKTVTKAIAKSILKKIPVVSIIAGTAFAVDRAIDGDWLGALGELSSGVIGTIPFYGTGVSLSIDAWLLNRDLTTNSPKGKMLKSRMVMYGAKPDEELIKNMLYIEEQIKPLLDSGTPTLNRDHIKHIASSFGFNPDNESHVDYLAAWVNQRVVRLYVLYYKILLNRGFKISDISNMEDSDIADIEKEFLNKGSDIVAKFNKFVPTLTAYKQAIGKSDVDNKVLSKRSSTLAEDIAQQLPRNINTFSITRKSTYTKSVNKLTNINPSVKLNKASSTLTALELQDSESAWINDIRFTAYGLTSNKQRAIILKYEAYLFTLPDAYEYLNDDLPLDRVLTSKLLASKFGVLKINIESFNSWLNNRFLPIFKTYVQTCNKYDIKHDHMQYVHDNKKVEFLDHFIKEVNVNMQKYGHLSPYPIITNLKDTNIFTESSEDVIKLTSTKNYGNVNLHNVNKSNTIYANSNVPTNKRINSVKNTSLETEFKLGSLSAQHESGNRESEAIGYDRNGGTSYGKYQLSSKTGTFNSFIKWMANKDEKAKIIAQRLTSAGNPNTGSRKGTVPDEWIALDQEYDLSEYEHEFIKETHYDKAFAKLPKKLQKKIKASEALQQVLWSTAVQHGAKHGATLMMRAGSQSKSDSTIVRKLYEERSLQFSSVSAKTRNSVRNRFYEEKAQALDMLVSENDKEKKTLDDSKVSEFTQNVNNKTNISDDDIIVNMGNIIASKQTEASKQKDTKIESNNIDKSLIVDLSNNIEIALSKSGTGQVEHLAKLNKNLITLSSIMEKALGENGAISKVGDAALAAANKTSNVVVPVVQAATPAAPKSNRLDAAIDMNFTKKKTANL